MTRPNGGAFLRVHGDPGESVAPQVAGTPWDPDRRPDPAPVDQLDVVRLFAQGKLWKTRTGRWVRVKDMSERHRRNTALFLLRDAAEWAQRVSMAELVPAFSSDLSDEAVSALFSADEARTRDPEGWMRSTKLYRRMVKGLPPVHPAGTCVVCDQVHGPGGPPTDAAVSPVVAATDALVARDPVAQAAAGVALQTVLSIFDERLQRGGPYYSRALRQQDVRDMVADAAKRIGVTL